MKFAQAVGNFGQYQSKSFHWKWSRYYNSCIGCHTGMTWAWEYKHDESEKLVIVLAWFVIVFVTLSARASAV